MPQKKETKGPSLIGLIFTAFSGVLLGSLLGMTLLVSAQATQIKTPPKEDVAPEIGDYSKTYMLGYKSPVDTSNLKAGLSRLYKKLPGPIPFAEADINRFLNQFRSPAKDADGNDLPVVVSSPNVRLTDEGMALMLPITINPGTEDFKLMLQVQGRWVNADNGPSFEMDEVYFNSMRFPGFGNQVIDALRERLSGTAIPEELVEAWKSIKGIETKERALIVNMGVARS